MNDCGIYKIQSKAKADKFYIGCSCKIKERWEQHLTGLRLNRHTNYLLQEHYNNYGENDLIFLIIFTCKKENMFKIEMFFHDRLNPYFNLNKYFINRQKQSNITKEYYNKICTY
jgi:hypothetical protein